jgi:hypothetical protein
MALVDFVVAGLAERGDEVVRSLNAPPLASMPIRVTSLCQVKSTPLAIHHSNEL